MINSVVESSVAMPQLPGLDVGLYPLITFDDLDLLDTLQVIPFDDKTLSEELNTVESQQQQISMLGAEYNQDQTHVDLGMYVKACTAADAELVDTDQTNDQLPLPIAVEQANLDDDMLHGSTDVLPHADLNSFDASVTTLAYHWPIVLPDAVLATSPPENRCLPPPLGKMRNRPLNVAADGSLLGGSCSIMEQPQSFASSQPSHTQSLRGASNSENGPLSVLSINTTVAKLPLGISLLSSSPDQMVPVEPRWTITSSANTTSLPRYSSVMMTTAPTAYLKSAQPMTAVATSQPFELSTEGVNCMIPATVNEEEVTSVTEPVREVRRGRPQVPVTAVSVCQNVAIEFNINCLRH